jgi:hypothetical protein
MRHREVCGQHRKVCGQQRKVCQLTPSSVTERCADGASLHPRCARRLASPLSMSIKPRGDVVSEGFPEFRAEYIDRRNMSAQEARPEQRTRPGLRFLQPSVQIRTRCCSRRFLRGSRKRKIPALCEEMHLIAISNRPMQWNETCLILPLTYKDSAGLLSAMRPR